ncbi:MAG: histidine phosphatase family protein [Patescibacteria group bacterium]
MKLFLVRHGETEENSAGILMGHHHGVLTEKGKQQAREIAEILKNHKFAHIYCSDLNRCIDTAEFIKESHLDTPLTFTKELREVNMGIFQGRKKVEVDWSSLEGDVLDKRPEGGESLRELRTRVSNFIRECYRKHPEDNVLFITHAGVIRQLVSHFTGMSSKDVFDGVKVGNAQVFEIEVYDDLSGKIINLSSQ